MDWVYLDRAVQIALPHEHATYLNIPTTQRRGISELQRDVPTEWVGGGRGNVERQSGFP